MKRSVLFSVAAALIGALPVTVYACTSAPTYEYKGSEVYLEWDDENDSQFSMVYANVAEGTHASEGEIIVMGSWSDNSRPFGIAYTRSGQCKAEFVVAGMKYNSNNPTADIHFTGTAPVLDASCNVIGHEPVTLEFNYVRN